MLKWYLVVIFGMAGILYVCSESRKVFLLKETAEIPMTKKKLNKWNRLNQMLNIGIGLAYLSVPVCWALEENHLISNLSICLDVSFTSIFILYVCRRIENKRVFGLFFTGDILEIKKDRDR